MEDKADRLAAVVAKLDNAEALLRRCREHIEGARQTSSLHDMRAMPETVEESLRQALSLGKQVMDELRGLHIRSSETPGIDRMCVDRTRVKFVDGKPQFGPDTIEIGADGKQFTGSIIASSDGRVAQNVGRGMAIIHDASRLDRVPAVGEAVCIMYNASHGRVVALLIDRNRDRLSNGPSA